METTPNAESVAPVVEEAPVYQEPADEPATETINMNAQQPVYQEPADELATETIDMNAEQYRSAGTIKKLMPAEKISIPVTAIANLPKKSFCFCFIDISSLFGDYPVDKGFVPALWVYYNRYSSC